MKRILLCLALIGCFTSFSYGEFTVTISDTYEFDVRLIGDQSLLVSGAGAESITAEDASYIEVRNTLPLEENVGGIKSLWLSDFSTMNFYNGEMSGFSIFDDATATFGGGRINFISSFQESDLIKHITMVVELDSINLSGNVLTGNWLNSGEAFSITLDNRPGFDPVISNINFIPEPATLTLLALGGTLLRSRRVLRRRRFHRPQQSQFRRPQ